MAPNVMQKYRDGLVKFCRLRLGLKPIIDRVQQKSRLNDTVEVAKSERSALARLLPYL